MNRNHDRSGNAFDRVFVAAEKLAEKDRAVAADREKEPHRVDSEPFRPSPAGMREAVELHQIRPRAHATTRAVRPPKVVEFAESIAALGLLQPILLDARNRLLAGAHRHAALQLLAVVDAHERVELAVKMFSLDVSGKQTEALLDQIRGLDASAFNRWFAHGIPVLRSHVDSATDAASALAVEVAENEKRINYNRDEINGLYQRLLAAGFVDRSGRPRIGEKSAKIALQHILGRSLATVKRALDREISDRTTDSETSSNDPVLQKVEREAHRLEKAVSRWKCKVVELVDAEILGEHQAKAWRLAIARAASN